MSSQLPSTAARRASGSRQAATAERVLSAGMTELREVGHEVLTIRTVAHRAGVSPATAYSYLASKGHLFAELFCRHLVASRITRLPAGSPTERVQHVARATVAAIVAEPELARAVTPALLGSDPDVTRLRLRIGAELVSRFEVALRDPQDAARPVDDAELQALVLTFSGALLQVGMGLMTYDEMADRVDSAVAVILRGSS